MKQIKPNFTEISPKIAELEFQTPAAFGSFTKRDIDLLCLSHLRWDFVYQRPQHLLSRCAQGRRVFFMEEPNFGDAHATPFLSVTQRDCGVWVVVPHLPHGLEHHQMNEIQSKLLDELLTNYNINNYSLWYYTPMALGFTDKLNPEAIIYDCMDELSAFKGAPPALRQYESQLFDKADLVFTGGQSLYEAKRYMHPQVYAFPSSIDTKHFEQARSHDEEPQDQAHIPGPRIGFSGVIDERMDIHLLDEIARLRPDWQFVMIGPVVKIHPDSLPKHANIHYLGGKPYTELPRYFASWDVAILPFAHNESTRFISPTKTPEYLASGRPVVSTSIRDVVRPYGQMGLVRIADTAEEFVSAIELAMQHDKASTLWQRKVDEFLAQNSWDRTWNKMLSLIESVEDKSTVMSSHLKSV